MVNDGVYGRGVRCTRGVNEMSDDELMGLNAYARHRGCAPNAVVKAERSGRIKDAVVRDNAGEFQMLLAAGPARGHGLAGDQRQRGVVADLLAQPRRDQAHAARQRRQPAIR